MAKRRTRKPTVRRLDTSEKVRRALEIPEGPPDDRTWPDGGRVSGDLSSEEGIADVLDLFERISASDSAAAPIPRSGVSLAYSLDDPERPSLLAEFAGYLILRREGKQLVWSERGAFRWFYFGTVVRADDGSLAVGELAVHPWSNAEGAGFRGLSREVLRAISPTGIVEAVARRRIVRRVSAGELRLEPLAPGGPRRGRRPSVPDDRMQAYALRYLELLDEGPARGIHARLAGELELPGGAAESREWARRARVRGFLTATHQGRAGALPGPRLTHEQRPKGESDA